MLWVPCPRRHAMQNVSAFAWHTDTCLLTLNVIIFFYILDAQLAGIDKKGTEYLQHCLP